MGDPKAFLNIPRQEAGYRPVNERIADYSQVEQTLNTNSRKLQASRCMDCGVPFCHWACPIGNKQRNGRMHYTGENGRRHTKYCRLLAIFRNLRDAFVLLFARNRVC
jgi:Fe-S-cluster-containing dehydrogenase component